MVTQRPHTTHSLDWESDKVDGVEFSLQNLEARLVADETSPAVGSKEGGYEGGFHVFQGNIQFFLTLLQVTIELSGDDQEFDYRWFKTRDINRISGITDRGSNNSDDSRVSDVGVSQL